MASSGGLLARPRPILTPGLMATTPVSSFLLDDFLRQYELKRSVDQQRTIDALREKLCKGKRRYYNSR